MNKPKKRYIEWMHWIIIFGILMGYTYYESYIKNEQPLPVYESEVVVHHPDSLMISRH